jgi:CRP-like cAMP-binding protein
VARVGKLTADGVAVPLAHLGPGDYFGEAALVARVPRTASVVAESDVELLTLDAGHFRRWVGGRLDVAAAVRRSLAERDTLLLFPILRGLGPADLDRLAARLVVTRHSAGDAIVRQGEPGEHFYLIADGRVEVVREDEGRATRLAELGAGDYFGEMALLHKAPRSATVRALTAVETYALGADAFHALLGRLPASTAIRRTAAERAGVAERPTVVQDRAG